MPLFPELLHFIHLLEGETFGPMQATHLAVPGLSWALVDGGYVLAAGGLAPVWPGRAFLWFLPSRLARPRDRLGALAFGFAWLETKQRDPAFARVECTVEVGFAAGHRVMRLGGFVAEGPPMRRWGPDGGDYVPYVKIREPEGNRGARTPGGRTDETGPAPHQAAEPRGGEK